VWVPAQLLFRAEQNVSDSKRDRRLRKVQWTAEDRGRHQAVRDMFRNWHPSPEELIASGEAANFELHGEYRELRPFVEEIKWAREAAGLTLPEVSRRCGINQPALSRLEKGHNKNPDAGHALALRTLPRSVGAWF
jgi:Helix-turn-helix